MEPLSKEDAIKSLNKFIKDIIDIIKEDDNIVTSLDGTINSGISDFNFGSRKLVYPDGSINIKLNIEISGKNGLGQLVRSLKKENYGLL